MNGTYARYQPDLERLELDNGGRRYFWVSKSEQIGAFIKEAGLKPVNRRLLLGGQTPLSAETEGAARQWQLIPLPFPGLPVPHFHFGGDIYLLSREQFERFSEPLISDFQARLGNAAQVSLDGLIAMSNAADLVQT